MPQDIQKIFLYIIMLIVEIIIIFLIYKISRKKNGL